MKFPATRNASTFLTALLLALTARSALAGVSIGAPASGPFAKIGAWIQDFVNFIDGPFGLAVVVISVIIAFITWVWVPREGILGPLLRIVVAAIAILNVAVWVASFRA
jgi:type IV secretory pathway VirB2 component (pilin)